MNIQKEIATSTVDSRSSLLRYFSLKFFLYSEFISYFFIVPILFINIILSLELDFEQLKMMFYITLVVVAISFSTTLINNHIVLAPVTKYFKALINKQNISEQMYLEAQHRFFNLPLYHSIGSFFRWMIGLSLQFVPFLSLYNFTSIQKINTWILVAIMAPFGSIFYFLMTEILTQKVLNTGVFPRIDDKNRYFSITFFFRITIVVVYIFLLSGLSLIGYFFIVMMHDKSAGFFSWVHLMGILGFGIVLSLSLGMALIRTIRDKIELIVSSVNRMGTGDFSENRKVTPVIDELSGANSTLYDMKEQVAGMFSDIIKASDVLTRSTDDISIITETFSSDTQNQAATVEEVSATIEEVSASMDTISSGTTDQIKSLTVLTERIQELAQIINESEVKASESKKMSQLISTYARSGESSLSRMDSNMQYISKSSEQMRAIISMINDISEQINLLSLNASIEAARAGSAGMGFAVVADEVSKLAESTATSVKEIDTLIKKSDSEISEGKQYVLEVINEMKKIIDGVANIAEMAGMISGYTIRQVESYKMVDDELRKVKEKSENIEIATAEQKRAMAEIVESTSRINELTQSISSGAEEIAASSGDIAKMAASQKEMTTRFKIREV